MEKTKTTVKTTASFTETRKRGFLMKYRLLVAVSEERYFTFGEKSKRTGKTPRRVLWLNEMLTILGGVSETVSPGLYMFKLTMNRRLQFISHLYPCNPETLDPELRELHKAYVENSSQ